MNKLVDKTNVFRFFCYQSALPSPYETMFSIHRLAEHFNTTRYHMRKIVKTLEQEGLIVLMCVGAQDEDGNVQCRKGYSITPKATESEIFKEENQRVVKELNDFLNDILRHD